MGVCAQYKDPWFSGNFTSLRPTWLIWRSRDRHTDKILGDLLDVPIPRIEVWLLLGNMRVKGKQCTLLIKGGMFPQKVEHLHPFFEKQDLPSCICCDQHQNRLLENT